MTLHAPARWRPARAGILNVYQYEDETLHFADGRLLLRGVNGSGKSTAMNMLLPFLLEADTRRIDAAGEQTGVLTSWMLADNDDTQRTGYLWVEFERPDADAPGGVLHHAVGCGIRANRSTNRTTAWWFSTPRRPRIDFSLTINRVPLSVEALRTELGSDAVFTTATDYRGEVARRFFGGADPSGYLALLHQVRNPRVGDRIDADLPRRLAEALPPVSEEAVLDAAQPLEDLEDHRRNVLALERTDRALGTVLDTYRQYARRVLAEAADRAAVAVTTARSAAQARGRLRTAADETALRRNELEAEVRACDVRLTRASAELSGVKESDAYRQVAALTARRAQVDSLELRARSAARVLDQAQRRLRTAEATLVGRRDRLTGDLTGIAAGLAALARHGRGAGTDLPLPPPPTLRTVRHDVLDVPEPGIDPLAAVELSPAADAVRARRQDVDRVRAAVEEAARARTDCDRARDAAEAAEEAAEAARDDAATAQAAAEKAGAEHRSAAAEWALRWAAHVAAVPAAAPGTAPGWLVAPGIDDPERGQLRAMAAARVAAAGTAADATLRTVEPTIAEAALRAHRARDRRDQVQTELEAVRATATLPLPRASWQQPVPPDGEAFAALVDFSPGLDDAARAGLEAACEAAGLLTAAVRPDGSIVTAAGELLLIAAGAVTPNLSTALVPVPGQGIGTEAIAAVLAAVGTGPASGAPLWVSTDGRFGAGPLRGRHAKPAAEHIGAGAREVARRRRIGELESELTRAEQELASQETVHATLTAWRDAVRPLLGAFPATRAVDDAATAAAGAVRDAHRATERASAARSAAVQAERRSEQAWARAETTAAEHRLPVTGPELDKAAGELDEAGAVLRRLTDALASARRSLTDEREAVTAWEHEQDAHAEAADEAEDARSQAAAERAELTATEAALGDTEERVAAQVADLTRRQAGLAEELTARRGDHTEAVAAASTAREQLAGAEEAVTRAEAACDEQRDTLRAVLAVDGLLLAACDGEPEPGLDPDVPGTVDGTARLVAAIREVVPDPVRPVDEDALDRSLRQIRDALGAGWDAGSRRAGDGAPVAVEVSGPYGRRPLASAAVQVGDDLRRARGLLTAQQDQALRNLLHGRVAHEVARALFEAGELIRTMNTILSEVTTSQGIGVRLEWRTRGDLDPATATALRLLAKDPDARTETEDASVRAAVAGLVEEARRIAPDAAYRDVIAQVLDYRSWHDLKIYLRRPGRADELLRRRTALSEGEKKLVTYLPMAAAAAASAAAHDPHAVGAPRLILLDDAFAKVSEDNHERLFGLLVSLDLDFIVTSERLFGTHASVPALSIVDVLRDPDLRTIALLHYHWDGRRRIERTTEPALKLDTELDTELDARLVTERAGA
jgi:uncharacterized protein (TIGR02680 family)